MHCIRAWVLGAKHLLQASRQTVWGGGGADASQFVIFYANSCTVKAVVTPLRVYVSGVAGNCQCVCIHLFDIFMKASVEHALEGH
jgi:hypothetical protein